MSNNEEDKNLIAYCGLYCGDCFAHKGKVADLARDLRKELRQAKFDKTAKSLLPYLSSRYLKTMSNAMRYWVR